MGSQVVKPQDMEEKYFKEKIYRHLLERDAVLPDEASEHEYEGKVFEQVPKPNPEKIKRVPSPPEPTPMPSPPMERFKLVKQQDSGLDLSHKFEKPDEILKLEEKIQKAAEIRQERLHEQQQKRLLLDHSSRVASNHSLDEQIQELSQQVLSISVDSQIQHAELNRSYWVNRVRKIAQKHNTAVERKMHVHELRSKIEQSARNLRAHELELRAELAEAKHHDYLLGIKERQISTQ
ncbi:hypothetical protein EDD86DRAFT_248222 [Gorgonomyces haynaldii]|nr:hypothetical protein EDD86DRAFT_248222 [Gorgonomyces haynaldii]